ncbi:(3S)-malyl-CoA thioesterase [Arboricoccus pini]|uniref:(3S)-malyl-CoA thioesterase n=1 Tax=Arboricoccus pini TaxID=1963835 RepID=A0A212R8M1_9PROT|nr:CoA ester lyase [Arboricoccus pini]SNB68430.1 (3S)-malyl-CoA thioesterase [Arboricoccus pini]
MIGQDRPRRSGLFLPASNERALKKARSLAADALILDLEDAVAPEKKHLARDAMIAALTERSSFRPREIVIRANALRTPWGEADLTAIGKAGPDAVLLPKVEAVAEIEAACAVLAHTGNKDLPVWCMIETALGVVNVEAIAFHSRVRGIVMGTSDLGNDLRLRPGRDRAPLLYALGRCVLAARAAGRIVLDGVHLDMDDMEGFLSACQQGRDMGFDGKTLIHPAQIEGANTAFGPSADEIEAAYRVIEAFESARQHGSGLAVLDGRLVENLHVEEARRLLAQADAISDVQARS